MGSTIKIPAPISISTMGGKLEGFKSLNVDTTTNEFCQKQQNAGVEVCQKCYSQRALTGYRKTAVGRFEINNASLSAAYPMPLHWIPHINAAYFRLFSHGDVANTNVARNVLLIVRAFPDTRFVAWSKNGKAWNEAIELDGKPENLRLVFSNSSMKRVRKTPPKGWDIVFNVVPDKKDSRINCNSKCVDCMLCYSKEIKKTCIIEGVK